LERAYLSAKDKSDIKAIVVINPGNPTRQVLTRDNLEAVIKFAAEKKLFVFADEVSLLCFYHH
jgi:alanine transaminase